MKNDTFAHSSRVGYIYQIIQSLPGMLYNLYASVY